MSKSNADSRTQILLTDSPVNARAKLRSAVTDSISHISYDPKIRPGISNLLSILSGLTDTPPEDLAVKYACKSVKDLKDAVGDALEPLLIRFQSEYNRVRKEEGFIRNMEKKGREKASRVSEEMMVKVREAVGLGYS